MFGLISAIVSGVQAVSSIFGGGGGGQTQKPPETVQDKSSPPATSGAQDSSKSTPLGAVAAALTQGKLGVIPEEITKVLNAVDGALSKSTTAQIRAEFERRMKSEKSAESSTPQAPSTASNTPAVSTTAGTGAGSATSSTTPTAATTPTSETTATAASNPTNARTRMQDGQAVFENDNYIIAAGDNNKVTVYNKKTKEVYEALGDPNMKIDGKQGFNLMGTTSLMLDDGTKVTLGKAEDGKGGTQASKLTITNGAYGSQIIGIDTMKTGDLAVQEFQGQGAELDQKVADGVVLKENQDININNGRGFSVADVNGLETAVDQAYIDKVDRRKTRGEQGENLAQFDQVGTPATTTSSESTATEAVTPPATTASSASTATETPASTAANTTAASTTTTPAATTASAGTQAANNTTPEPAAQQTTTSTVQPTTPAATQRETQVASAANNASQNTVAVVRRSNKSNQTNGAARGQIASRNGEYLVQNQLRPVRVRNRGQGSVGKVPPPWVRPANESRANQFDNRRTYTTAPRKSTTTPVMNKPKVDKTPSSALGMPDESRVAISIATNRRNSVNVSARLFA
jgi:Domain of Unknown Function (DUF1521)